MRPREPDRSAGDDDETHLARRPRERRLVVVDRRAALLLPAVALGERVRVHRATGTLDRIGRVADEVLVAVGALVVRPPVALFLLRVVPEVGVGVVVAHLRRVAGHVVAEDRVVARVAEPEAPVHVVLDRVLEDAVVPAAIEVDDRNRRGCCTSGGSGCSPRRGSRSRPAGAGRRCCPRRSTAGWCCRSTRGCRSRSGFAGS